MFLALGSAAAMGTQILAKLEKYHVTHVMSDNLAETLLPGIGASISAFKAGIKFWQEGVAISNLEKLKTDKATLISEEEKLLIEKYVVKIKTDRVSVGIDVALKLGQVATSFFPPFSVAPILAKAAKDCIFGGIDAWEKYKSQVEQKSLLRISGGEDPLSKGDLDGVKDLNKKMNQQPVRGAPTMSNLVKTRMQIKKLDFDLQFNMKDPVANKPKIDEIRGDLNVWTNALRVHLEDYNSSLSRVPGFVKVNLDDVDNIAAFHRNTIMRIIEEAKAKKGMVKSITSFFSKEKKDKIINENKIITELLGSDITEADIEESISILAESIESRDYFWTKTKKAIAVASNGKEHYSKKELGTKLKEILKKYEIPDPQIERMIVLGSDD